MAIIPTYTYNAESSWTYGGTFGRAISITTSGLLEDTTLSANTYGKPIPYSFGDRRIVGQMIWAKALDRSVNAYLTQVRSDPDTGQLTSYGVANYSYQATFAVSFGIPGPGTTTLRKLWANASLLYDADVDGSLPSYIRFYDGSETQTADSAIIADKGVEAPAYRPQTYAVIEGLDLTPYATQIPTITAEIRTSSVTVDLHNLTYIRVYLDCVAGSTSGMQAVMTVTGSGSPADGVGTYYGSAASSGGTTYVQSRAFDTLNDTEWLIYVGRIRVANPSITSLTITVQVGIFGASSTFYVNAYGHDGTSSDWDSWAGASTLTSLTGPGSAISTSSVGSFVVTTGFPSLETLTPISMDTTVDLGTGGGGGPTTYTLGQFILDVATLIGYADGEVTVSNLDDEIAGAIIDQDFDFRNLLMELAGAFGFDVSFGDVIACVRPPSGTDFAVDVALTAPDIVDENNKAIVSNRAEAGDLPTNVEIRYLDASLNYSYANQIAHRPQYPIRTTFTNTTKTYSVPVVLTGAQAAGLAARALYRAWNSRLDHTLRLFTQRIDIEPGDIISFPLDSNTYIAKVTEATIGADLSLGIKAQGIWVDDDLTRDADALVTIDPYAARRAESTVVIIDTVLVDPADDTAGASLRDYFAAYPTALGLDWPGATVYYSTDNVSYTSLGTIATAPLLGIAANGLGNWLTPASIDTTNTLSVSFKSGDTSGLQSVTTADLTTGANLCALGAPGRWELLQPRLVEYNTDGTVTLSEFMRGVNDTESFIDTHQAGDTFLLLDGTGYFKTTLPKALLNTTIYIKAVGTGETAADVPGVATVVHGYIRSAPTPATGHLAVTGYAPGVFVGTLVQPTTGNVTVTGHNPTVTTTATLASPSTGHVTVTGHAPTVGVQTGVVPGTGHITVTGYAPTVTLVHSKLLGEGGSNRLLGEGGTSLITGEG